ncbi:nucleoside transporter [Parahaliea aestuarii]|uniref:Nucleoside transporter n=1 Tax=Parahaliea aestuarii TaxID=1852021 RepID=A0A5C8ZXB7_9GAMM|nr:nucleoside transporter [Parahaliea aestuarii]TXS93098.1 nucleoside transporter [Parahaliea aestuarii]
MDNNEFERSPVTPERLQPARHFAANYAGEHVAGTEFVIGAMFVAWGVSTSDILWGLLWGNLLAVLSWGLICAPIAVNTRLTLYAYLEKIAGPGTIRVYSVVNGLLFCVLAGTMITVSASAVRIPFGIDPQTHWYPTNPAFVAVVLLVGAVVVYIAARGFQGVARFAEVCAPWMILIFLLGALSMLPELTAATEGIDRIGSLADLRAVADQWVWQGEGSGEITAWHVAAFAWICNLAMHGGLSDMTVLRYARRASYGYFSVLGMFIGHYAAWAFAGIMGAGAAMLLGSSIQAIDAGEVAYQALGTAGIIAVIIAGWTTANPTIYRAGLAFQSLNPSWDRVKVTMVVGVVTTLIACFPFVFSRLMDFVGIMGLVLSPIGAIIVAEHWILPRLGMTRYWSTYRGNPTNWAAIGAWLGSLLVAAALWFSDTLHLFFLLVPTWVTATMIYLAAASALGAKARYAEAGEAEQQEERRRQQEDAYLDAGRGAVSPSKAGEGIIGLGFYRAVSLLALLACLVMGSAVFVGGLDLDSFRQYLIVPTAVYLLAAYCWMRARERL